MAGSRTVVGQWEYFTIDNGDWDTKRDLHHFVVNVDSGEQKTINFSRYAYMQPADILRLQEMGWPEHNTTLGHFGSPWTSRDIELSWLRGIERLRRDLEMNPQLKIKITYGRAAAFFMSAAVIALIILTYA